MEYPRINTSIKQRSSQQLAMGGINMSDNYVSGQMESCKGISSRRYPYITTDYGIEEISNADLGLSTELQPGSYYSRPEDIFGWEGLFVISNEKDSDGDRKCFYDGDYCGSIDGVNLSRRRMYAVINSKLVVFPDKVYFDLYKKDGKSHALTTASFSLKADSGYKIKYSNTSDGEGRLYITSTDTGISSGYEGIEVYIKGTYEYLNDGKYTIKSASTWEDEDTGLYTTRYTLTTAFNYEGSHTLATDESIYFYYLSDSDGNKYSYVPDFDYICSYGNRLYGVCNDTRTLYVSALGDPTDFWTFEGTTLDAYQAAIGSSGNFTGICALNNQILIFKENIVHKLIGNYPSEFTLYTYETEGVAEGNWDSIAVVEGSVLYASKDSIRRYSGSTSSAITEEIRDNFQKATGYYIDGKYYFTYQKNDTESQYESDTFTYVLDVEHGLWIERDYGHARRYASVNGNTYMIYKYLSSSGSKFKVYKINTQENISSWEIVFKPFFETISGSYKSQSHIFEKKKYTSITIRVELPKGSWMKAEISCDGKPYVKAGRIEGKNNNVQDFIIRTPRSDKVQLKLSGEGPMTILAMERDYIIGSRR